jgi:hypothetical protein
VNQETLVADAAKQTVVKTAEADTEEAYKEAIAQFPTSNEKRVVSYGLYGSNPKYTIGAVRNSELVHVWFPGWVARFYCDDTVPPDIIKTLKKNGAVRYFCRIIVYVLFLFLASSFSTFFF